MTSKTEIPLFESYSADQLTLGEARRNRNAIVHQIDKLVDFAEPYVNHDDAFFAQLSQKYNQLRKQEKLYRKYTFALFSSSKKKIHPRSPKAPAPLISSSHRTNPVSPSSNVHNTAHDALDKMDIPDLPIADQQHQNNQNQSLYSSNIYHSDEEKCEREEQVPKNQNPPPRKTRVPPPNRPNAPFIEDEHNANGNTKEHQLVDRVAVLLFIHWPHPINVNELESKYWDYYKEVLGVELTQLEQANNAIFTKKKNPFATAFSTENAHYFYELSDVQNFFVNVEKSQQYELIRAKVSAHFNDYHPQGLLRTELKKMFRYWVGPNFSEFDIEYKQDLFKFLFDEHKDNMQLGYIVVKGLHRPQFPLEEPWKVYALNARHMMICILSEYDGERNKSGMTLVEFGTVYRKYFGVAFDWKSHKNQMTLMNVIDQTRFQSEGVLSLSEGSAKKSGDWIQWWRRNIGEGKNIDNNNTNNENNINHMNHPNINNMNNANDNEQHHINNMNHMNTSNINNAQHQTQMTQYGTEEYKDNQYPRGYANYHDNPNQNTQYNESNHRTFQPHPRNAGGGRHDPDCLLFISQFPENTKDPEPFMKAIEQEYDVKFNNFRRAYLKQFSRGPALSPIPVETKDMASKLIEIGYLTLKNFPGVELGVRQYRIDRVRQNDNYRGGQQYNSHKNNQGYNDDAGGYNNYNNKNYNRNRRGNRRSYNDY